MKKISKIVYKYMLNYKKEKPPVKVIKQMDFYFFFTFFLFLPASICSDLTGISKVPDLGQIWTLSTDALKQEKKKKVDKLGVFHEKISTNGPHF